MSSLSNGGRGTDGAFEQVVHDIDDRGVEMEHEAVWVLEGFLWMNGEIGVERGRKLEELMGQVENAG